MLSWNTATIAGPLAAFADGRERATPYSDAGSPFCPVGNDVVVMRRAVSFTVALAGAVPVLVVPKL